MIVVNIFTVVVANPETPSVVVFAEKGAELLFQKLVTSAVKRSASTSKEDELSSEDASIDEAVAP
ncbi:MAG: hypothetical protein FWD27_09295 [Coriobacteriia bacterium]|nr:hypothetical protein [Coriobacteriia bacterium]